jgi:ABC-type multidrug transport system ATPase subunit
MPHADKQAVKLSGGNRRKLSLAIALMGDPSVLILDEPSSAMDAAAKRVMWRALAEEIAPGRSVLLTTHSMEEADALATRAAILSRRMLAVGTTQDLRQLYGNLYHVSLVLRSAPHSSIAETLAVEDWVRNNLRGAVFEGASLGGQVKFTIPISSALSSSGASGADTPNLSDGHGIQPVSDSSKLGATSSAEGTGVGHIIGLLEAQREELGLLDYSIGSPTLEKVFLSVIKDNYQEEEERKPPLWRRVLGLA